MSKYKILLLDADDTLLDFHKGQIHSFKRLIEYVIGDFNENIFNDYQVINKNLWKQFENGEISKEQVTLGRYEKLFKKYNISFDPEVADKMYLDFLSECPYLVDDCIEVLQKLSKKYDMYCITNGVERAQYGRLNVTGIKKYFKDIFVSESIGFNKPSIEYFEHVLDVIKEDKDKMLIVGDSLSSDIKGGNNIGIDTCWYNPKGVVNDQNFNVTYEIRSLKDLLTI